jgi:hypothetical protein
MNNQTDLAKEQMRQQPEVVPFPVPVSM